MSKESTLKIEFLIQAYFSFHWEVLVLLFWIVKNRGWKLNNFSSFIHHSSGVSSYYSLLFLSSCWLLIIMVGYSLFMPHYSWFSKPKYSLFIFYLILLLIIQLPSPMLNKIKNIVKTRQIVLKRVPEIQLSNCAWFKACKTCNTLC